MVSGRFFRFSIALEEVTHPKKQKLQIFKCMVGSLTWHSVVHVLLPFPFSTRGLRRCRLRRCGSSSLFLTGGSLPPPPPPPPPTPPQTSAVPAGVLPVCPTLNPQPFVRTCSLAPNPCLMLPGITFFTCQKGGARCRSNAEMSHRVYVENRC